MKFVAAILRLITILLVLGGLLALSMMYQPELRQQSQHRRTREIEQIDKNTSELLDLVEKRYAAEIEARDQEIERLERELAEERRGRTGDEKEFQK